MSTTVTGLTGCSQVQNGTITPSDLASFATLGNYVNDAAAAVGGVPVGGLYRNGSILMVRIS